MRVVCENDVCENDVCETDKYTIFISTAVFTGLKQIPVVNERMQQM